MEHFCDLVKKFKTLTEVQRPGPGHQQSKYEKSDEDIQWDGFASAVYDATGKKGGFLSESNSDNIIIALFGASGSGKSWYKKLLVDQGWREIRTNTTRTPRGPEDTEYNFHSEQEFADLLNRGELINTNEYLGQMYGTNINDFTLPGRSVMLTDITSLDSLKQTAKKYNKELVLIYTAAPNEKEMERRHASRGTPERMSVASSEIEQEGEILQRGDIYIVRNVNDLDTLVRNLERQDEGPY